MTDDELKAIWLYLLTLLAKALGPPTCAQMNPPMNPDENLRPSAFISVRVNARLVTPPAAQSALAAPGRETP